MLDQCAKHLNREVAPVGEFEDPAATLIYCIYYMFGNFQIRILEQRYHAILDNGIVYTQTVKTRHVYLP